MLETSGLRVAPGRVQSDDLVADDVLARLERRGDGEGVHPVVLPEDISRCPLPRGGLSGFVDFEPHLATSGTTVLVATWRD